MIVRVSHPYGEHEMTLREWMATGPGKRPWVSPYAARDASTGMDLPLSVIPIKFRNNLLSRVLIKLGFFDDPWLGKADQ